MKRIQPLHLGDVATVAFQRRATLSGLSWIAPHRLHELHFAEQVSETMHALAAPSRLRILSRLYEAPSSVGELSAAVGMEASAVSHQLRVLRHLGLVVGERDGRRVVYQLHDDHVGQLLAEAMSHVEHLRLGLASGAARETLTAQT